MGNHFVLSNRVVSLHLDDLALASLEVFNLGRETLVPSLDRYRVLGWSALLNSDNDLAGTLPEPVQLQPKSLIQNAACLICKT